MNDWLFAIGMIVFGVALLLLLVFVFVGMLWTLYRLLFGRDDS